MDPAFDADHGSTPAVGFAPAQISGCVNRLVLREHVDAAAFLWRQRRRAVVAPHYKLKHLALLDERLRGHLEGLRTGGTTAVAMAQEALGDAEPGTVFVFAYLAFSARDKALMRHALQVALADADFGDPLIAALAWLPLGSLAPVLDHLARSEFAGHRRAALAAFSARRIDARELARRSLDDADPALRSRALRAAGETRRVDLLEGVRAAQTDRDPACRLRAVQAAALLGDAGASAEALALSRQPGTSAEVDAALEVAVRCSPLEVARNVIRSLINAKDMRRAVAAIGALGDPAGVSWLLTCMREPAHARIAGEAFSTVTGADLGYLGLKQDPPEHDEAQDRDEDIDLPWPQPDRVAAWWRQEQARVGGAARLLCGQPMTPDGLLVVLRHGYQRDRRRAAFELARRGGASMLFPVDDRADRQAARLAS